MDQPIPESMNAHEAADYLVESGILGQTDADQESEEVEEAPQEDTDEAEAEEAEAEETEDDSDDESEEAEPEEETEAPSLESVADLAEALEVPMDELANLKYKIKVQGEEQEVTLSELAQGYQKDADYRQKTSELADRRREFEQQEQAVKQRLTQDAQMLGQLAQALEQYAVPKPDPNEMEYLKQTDPNQYLIRKSEYDDARNRYAQLYAQLGQAQQHYGQQFQQQHQQQLSEALQKSAEAIPERVSDWSKEKGQALDNYLLSGSYGFTEDSLSNAYQSLALMGFGPQFIELVDKAQKWDTKAKDVETAQKKVKSLPPVQKPKKAAPQVKTSKLAEARKRFGKSRSLDDGAKVIEALL